MPSNADIEMRWVEAWNDLYDLIGKRTNVPCCLDSGQVVDVEACKGWLQESVYQGWEVKVEAGYILGKKGVLASRWRSF